MKKVEIIFLTVMVALASCVGGMFLDAAMTGAGKGTIIGSAYVDQGCWGSLDEQDRPAEGFVVELYRVSMKPTAAELVATATADYYGKYEFKVAPGKYYVIPKLGISGYPAWNEARHLKEGNLTVEKGKTALGPIFLLRESSGKG